MEITTDLNPDNPFVVDGPAFHIARKNLERLKKAFVFKRDKTIILRKNFEEIRVDSQPDIDVSLENDAARLLFHQVRDWNVTRWRIYELTVRGIARSKIASDLDISESAISKSVRMGAVDTVISLTTSLGKSLSRKLKG